MNAPLASQDPANGEWRMANGPETPPAPHDAPIRAPAPSPPPPSPHSGDVELAILPDGTVYAHHLTPAIARVLRLLNPADDSMRQRAGDGATHEPTLTPGPSPVRRERVARASLEPGEGLPSGRFMVTTLGSATVLPAHEPPDIP